MKTYVALAAKVRTFINSLHVGEFYVLLFSYAGFFSKLTFKKIFQEHYQSVKGLDPDQG